MDEKLKSVYRQVAQYLLSVGRHKPFIAYRVNAIIRQTDVKDFPTTGRIPFVVSVQLQEDTDAIEIPFALDTSIERNYVTGQISTTIQELAIIRAGAGETAEIALPLWTFFDNPYAEPDE